MKTQKAADTKEAILEAAKQLFMEKSVNKVSVSEIVKRAGVAKGTFYLYFESKEALVWGFIDTEIVKAGFGLDLLSVIGYDEKAIETFVATIMHYVRKHIMVLKMMHHVRFYSFLGIESMEKKYLSKWVTNIEQWLKSGNACGAFDIQDTEFMAYYLVITVHEMIDRVILEQVPFDLNALEKQLKILLKKMIL